MKLEWGTFKAYVGEGDKVRKGTKIVSFNLQEKFKSLAAGRICVIRPAFSYGL